MKKNEFIKMIALLQKLKNGEDVLLELGVDIIDREEDYFEIIGLMRSQVFTKEQEEIIDHYLYEEDKKIYNPDETLLIELDSPETLFDYVITII